MHRRRVLAMMQYLAGVGLKFSEADEPVEHAGRTRAKFGLAELHSMQRDGRALQATRVCAKSGGRGSMSTTCWNVGDLVGRVSYGVACWTLGKWCDGQAHGWTA